MTSTKVHSFCYTTLPNCEDTGKLSLTLWPEEKEMGLVKTLSLPHVLKDESGWSDEEREGVIRGRGTKNLQWMFGKG